MGKLTDIVNRFAGKTLAETEENTDLNEIQALNTAVEVKESSDTVEAQPRVVSPNGYQIDPNWLNRYFYTAGSISIDYLMQYMRVGVSVEAFKYQTGEYQDDGSCEYRLNITLRTYNTETVTRIAEETIECDIYQSAFDTEKDRSHYILAGVSKLFIFYIGTDKIAKVKVVDITDAGIVVRQTYDIPQLASAELLANSYQSRGNVVTYDDTALYFAGYVKVGDQLSPRVFCMQLMMNAGSVTVSDEITFPSWAIEYGTPEIIGFESRDFIGGLYWKYPDEQSSVWIEHASFDQNCAITWPAEPNRLFAVPATCDFKMLGCDIEDMGAMYVRCSIDEAFTGFILKLLDQNESFISAQSGDLPHNCQVEFITAYGGEVLLSYEIDNVRYVRRVAGTTDGFATLYISSGSPYAVEEALKEACMGVRSVLPSMNGPMVIPDSYLSPKFAEAYYSAVFTPQTTIHLAVKTEDSDLVIAPVFTPYMRT